MNVNANNNMISTYQSYYNELMGAVKSKELGGIKVKNEEGTGVVSIAEQNRETKAAVFKVFLAQFREGNDVEVLLAKDFAKDSTEIEDALGKWKNPYVKEAFKFLLCGDDAKLSAKEVKMLDEFLKKGVSAKNLDAVEVAKDVKELHRVKNTRLLDKHLPQFGKAYEETVKSAVAQQPNGLDRDGLNGLLGGLGNTFAEHVEGFLKKKLEAEKRSDLSFADSVIVDDLCDAAGECVADALLDTISKQTWSKKELDSLIDEHTSSAAALRKTLKDQGADNEKNARALQFKVKVLVRIIAAAKEASPNTDTGMEKTDKAEMPKGSAVNKPEVQQEKIHDVSKLTGSMLMKQSSYASCCWFFSAINALKSTDEGRSHLQTLVKDSTVKFYDKDGKSHVYDLNKDDLGCELDKNVWDKVNKVSGCTKLEKCVMYHAKMYGANAQYKVGDSNDMDSVCKMLGLIPMPMLDSNSTTEDCQDLLAKIADLKLVTTFNPSAGHFISVVGASKDKVMTIDSMAPQVKSENSALPKIVGKWNDGSIDKASSLYFMMLPSELDTKLSAVEDALQKLEGKDITEYLDNLKLSWDASYGDYISGELGAALSPDDLKKSMTDVAKMSALAEILRTKFIDNEENVSIFIKELKEFLHSDKGKDAVTGLICRQKGKFNAREASFEVILRMLDVYYKVDPDTITITEETKKGIDAAVGRRKEGFSK